MRKKSAISLAFKNKAFILGTHISSCFEFQPCNNFVVPPVSVPLKPSRPCLYSNTAPLQRTVYHKVNVEFCVCPGYGSPLVSYVKLRGFTLCFVWLNTSTLYFTAPLSLGGNPKCQHEISGWRESLATFSPRNTSLCFLEILLLLPSFYIKI